MEMENRGVRSVENMEYGICGVWKIRSMENTEYDHIKVHSANVNGDMLSLNCKNYNVRSMIT